MAKRNLSKLQENFTCLAIVCVDHIKLPLMAILENHIKPPDLYYEINSSTLISANKLRPDQKKLCYITPPGIPDYSKFDVTLLYTLIRNLCPSLKPSGRWGEEPAASHTQLGDDIERLRLFRNEQFAHANSAEISDGEFNKLWTDLQTVINRIQSNKKAGCKTDYLQTFKSIENRLLNWDDLEKYKLFLEATIQASKQREDMDGPAIWIEGSEEAVCGSTAHFQANVKERKVSFLSVSWKKLIKNESKPIDTSNKKFWGKTNKELFIESVCKEDEGEYQAVLSFEEDRIGTTIKSNVIFLRVVGGIPTVTTSHETCLQTHSVKLIGNVFVIDDLPVIDEIYWTKNGNKIDTQVNEGKYSKVSVDIPSLTIYNVNQYDAGHYTLTATNAAGTTVSDVIVLGAPDIVLGESKDESDGSQIFTVTITSIPAAYNIQWQVSENNSDMFTNLDENAEEYRGTSHSVPHPVLVVRLKEHLKNNKYQIEVQNFVRGRRKKIPSILNIFYKDRGAGVMFAKLFNEIVEQFPEGKLNQLQDLTIDSCRDKDKDLPPLIKTATSAREYFRILKDKELFTPSDVIFMQFLLRESNCGPLNDKCIAYAKTQKALCFYEEPPRNGYKKVQFHVQGNISNYTSDQIGIIKETVVAIVGCDSEDIHLDGFLNSDSFFVVLSMKERYVNGLFNMNQQDEEKLVNLNIDYFIIDSNHIYLKNPKVTEEHTDPTALPDEILIVAALDFGTTYSGIAWSFTKEFEKYPLRINSLMWSPIEGPSQATFKTPTVLLLKSNKEVVAFGYAAEEQYGELADNNAHHGYYFYRNFKMLLYENKTLRNDTVLVDDEGHAMQAKDIFGHSIRYMNKRLLDDLQARGNMIRNENIMWVVTIPAIWNDGAKQFMREAAIMAGIPAKQFRLALEPEAASIYAKEVLIERTRGNIHQQMPSFEQGTKYIVLDLGGGTVDISLKEIAEGNNIKEIHHATVGPWGGLTVNKEFMAFLESLIGKDVLEELKKNHKSAWLDLEREVEAKKRNISGDKDGRILIQIPAELLEIFENKKNKKLINTIAFETKYAGKIDIKRNCLRVDKSIVETFFKTCLDNILNHTRTLLGKPEAAGLKYMVLVGGFAESEYIREELSKAFGQELHVFIPDEPWLAVMRGAVLFGQNPTVIQTRISKFTYGTNVIRYFMTDYDDPQHKIEEDGETYCKNVFNKLAEIGQSFELGETVSTEVFVHRADMRKMKVRLYKSTEKNPRYVTDKSCTQIGQMEVDMPGFGMGRMVMVSLCFGEEEITCSGRNESQESVHVSLNLLGDG